MNIKTIKQIIKSKVDLLIAKLNSAIIHTPIVHVFADSHGVIFLNYKTFLVHPVGSATAYNLINKNSSTQTGNKILAITKNISKNDYVLLIFGEIDCRIHVYNEYMKCFKKKTIKKIIKEITKNYREFISEIKNEGIEKMIVSSIPPTSIQKNKYNYNFYASQKTRVQITQEFNKQLEILCKKQDVAFLDMHTEFENAKGITLDEFRQDTTHLNKKILPIITKQINKIIQQRQ